MAELTFGTNMFDARGSNSNASHALLTCVNSVDTGAPTSLQRAKVTQKIACFLSTISIHGIVSILFEVCSSAFNAHQCFVFRNFHVDVDDALPLSAGVGHCVGNSL